MHACHVDDGKPYLHKIDFWFIWSLQMTSDGEVLSHRYAVKCDVARSETIRNPKVLSPMFVGP